MSKKYLKFKTGEHTADLKLKIYGGNFGQLLKNAACGVFHLLELDKLNPGAKTIKIRLSAEDQESLLVLWINELLYTVNSDRFFPSKLKSLRYCKNNSLTAEVSGYRKKSGVKIPFEIKSATYHELKIKKCRRGVTAEIILDI